MITVLIVDDNPSVRATLRPLLEADGTVSVVGEAGNGTAALATAARLRPRVTLLDYRMPVADGLSVIERISRLSAVLVLTSSADPDLIVSMLCGGARGYLVYGQFDPTELIPAVHAVAAGQGWLTPAVASVATDALREAHARDRRAVARTERLRADRERYGLTDREVEVITLIGAGMSNASIADRLELSEKTVKNHVSSIFAKLDATSRTEAAARWNGRR